MTILSFILLLNPTFLKITVPHIERNTSIYEVTDPGVLLVNALFPTKPLTLFDYILTSQVHLPVGLHEVEDDVLRFQVWHVYYESATRHFYLELEYDKNITTEVGSNLLQAKRGAGVHQMKVSSLDGGKFFTIMNGSRCLTVDTQKSQVRDSYPVRFRECNKGTNQKFAFVSKMQALCSLGNDLCPADEDDLFTAEAIILKRLSQFIN